MFDGFVAAGYLEIHGSVPFFDHSVYLECGLGLEGRNVTILKALGLHIKGHGRPYVAGGDPNLTPEEMEESEWPSRLGGCIVTGHTKFTTATAGETGRHIDDYIVDERLSDAGLSGQTIFEVPMRTHLGVSLRFPARPALFKQSSRGPGPAR